MLESGLSGSVRGVLSNGHPYRDPGPRADVPAIWLMSRQPSRAAHGKRRLTRPRACRVYHNFPTDDELFQIRSSSSALASLRSAVSKPSVNQP
jgi:hypothetical protein